MILWSSLNCSVQAQCEELKKQRSELLKEWNAASRTAGIGKKSDEVYDFYNPKANSLAKQIEDCEKNYWKKEAEKSKNNSNSSKNTSYSGGLTHAPSTTNSSSKAFSNNNNLNFAGASKPTEPLTPQEQNAIMRDYYLSQLPESSRDLIQGTQRLSEISKEKADSFVSQLTTTQRKVEEINQNTQQHQPKDERGIMQNAKNNNLSTDNLGPGQEEDEPTINPTDFESLGNQQVIKNDLLNQFSDKVQELAVENLVSTNSFFEAGKTMYDRVTTIDNGLTAAKQLVNGQLTPETVANYFPKSPNAVIGQIQEVATNFLGKHFGNITGALDNMPSVENMNEQDFENRINGIIRPSVNEKNVPQSSNSITVRDVVAIGVGGAVLSTAAVPISVGIGAAALYAWNKNP